MTATKSSHPDFFFTSSCLILPHDNQVFVWLAGNPDQQQMQIKTSYVCMCVHDQVKPNTDQFLDLVQPVLADRR